MNHKHLYLILTLAAVYISVGTHFANAQQAAKVDADKLVWHDVKYFGVEGQGWTKTDLESPYDRLPSKAQDFVRGAVWKLSRHSAGLNFRFNTDATQFTIRYTLGDAKLAMPHMPATGVSGMDLYALSDGQWKWVEVARPTSQNVSFKVGPLDKGKRTYLAYLPLYNSVTKIEVGIPAGSVFEPITPRTEKPIVFYGTSITQGACASRPGLTHAAILSRRFDHPVVNLGFSGNGKMEAEVVALLAEIDASVFIIDCLPNMTGDEVAENTEPLVKKLREARPDTPIILVEDRTFTNAWVKAGKRLRHDANRTALVRTYDLLIEEGVKKLYYIEGENLLGGDSEGTTDGSHPNDLGGMRQANHFETVIKKALGL